MSLRDGATFYPKLDTLVKIIKNANPILLPFFVDNSKALVPYDPLYAFAQRNKLPYSVTPKYPHSPAVSAFDKNKLGRCVEPT